MQHKLSDCSAKIFKEEVSFQKMEKKKDILVFSVPRTGSTLIYNILKEVFGTGNIRAVHSFELPHDYIVIPFRDFRDSLVSWRTRDMKRKSRDPKEKMNFLELLNYIIWIKRYIRIQRRYEKLNKKIVWLKYERFYNDYDYACDVVEDYFKIEINKKMRNQIKKKYSMSELKKVGLKVEGNKAHDEDTKVSKYHVHTGTPNYWKEIIPKKYWFFTYLALRSDLLKYGYGRGY